MFSITGNSESRRSGKGQHENIDTAEVDRFLNDPVAYFGYSATKIQSTNPNALARLHLEALRRRFATLRDRIPMLSRLADAQAIHSIETLADTLPLLFTHETYKSYPVSLLQKKRFEQLTAWIGKLTTTELSKNFMDVDVSACESIDDWMMELRRNTPLALCHSSGTSGTMSFIPWSKDEIRSFILWYAINNFQEFGAEPSPDFRLPLDVPCLYPYYRSGGSVHLVANDYFAELIGGSDDNFHAAYPGRLSSDLLLLAAKLRGAEAKGQIDQLEISPELMARREAFASEQRGMPNRMAEFFDLMREKFSGHRIFMMATANLLYATANRGLSLGIRNVFDPSSVIVTGGGGKGMVLPENWQETVKEYFGVKRLHMGYGMSEMSGAFFQCDHGHYHTTPWIIPFVLDPDTAKPLPRTGKVTGRFAFFDLMAKHHWGGFITGDEVTMTWDDPCPCGRSSAYLDSKIQRLSEKAEYAEDDEKISCAATPSAYAEALDFLNSTSL